MCINNTQMKEFPRFCHTSFICHPLLFWPRILKQISELMLLHPFMLQYAFLNHIDILLCNCNAIISPNKSDNNSLNSFMIP